MSKIDFRPKQPASVVEQELIVGGNCVGWVKEYVGSDEKLQFHVGINIETSNYMPALIQGFGDTPELAIKNALVKGHKLANDLYNGIDRMQFDMDIKISQDEIKKES